jgi:hypothetical protein
MANKWGIPKEVEQSVISRDKNCVYCGVFFLESVVDRKIRRSWEHIVNDIRIKGPENIALCCISCNASKGSKLLEDWLTSKYCQTKGITFETVAPIVRSHLVKVKSK